MLMRLMIKGRRAVSTCGAEGGANKGRGDKDISPWGLREKHAGSYHLNSTEWLAKVKHQKNSPSVINLLSLLRHRCSVATGG